MIVATIFIAAVYCYYPKARILCLSVTVLLAAWLIAFDFHFISDVIAGAYLGLVVHLAVWRRRALLERAS